MTVSLFCIGISHKQASVELRERSALSTAQQDQLLTLAAAGQLHEVLELAILSTCNRIEFYFVGESQAAPDTLLAAWAERCALTPASLSQEVFILSDEACIRHLLEVGAGLDSQVVGEPQILGQVAESYDRARVHRSAQTVLSALMQRAIQVGKQVRTETALGTGAFSIGSVAASHSRQIFGSLATATVLIVGTGEMAQSAVASLVRQGVDRLLIANHTWDHAQEMAEKFGGEVVTYTQLGKSLVTADLVISAVSAPHPVLHVADLTPILPQRGDRPLVIFDIALPRNVEPEVGKLPGVRLFNLDDLQAVTDAHAAVRLEAVPVVQSLIETELKAFQVWQAGRGAVPVIRGLRAKAESIRQAELSWLLGRLDLDEHSQALVEEFSERLVNKLLHQPTLTLKEKSAQGQGDLYADLVDDLFQLTPLVVNEVQNGDI